MPPLPDPESPYSVPPFSQPIPRPHGPTRDPESQSHVRTATASISGPRSPDPAASSERQHFPPGREKNKHLRGRMWPPPPSAPPALAPAPARPPPGVDRARDPLNLIASPGRADVSELRTYSPTRDRPRRASARPCCRQTRRPKLWPPAVAARAPPAGGGSGFQRSLHSEEAFY